MSARLTRPVRNYTFSLRDSRRRKSNNTSSPCPLTGKERGGGYYFAKAGWSFDNVPSFASLLRGTHIRVTDSKLPSAVDDDLSFESRFKSLCPPPSLPPPASCDIDLLPRIRTNRRFENERTRDERNGHDGTGLKEERRSERTEQLPSASRKLALSVREAFAG